jgi:hypothetical protein
VECNDLATQEKAAGKLRLLLCDGHGNHITGSFVDFCLKNTIQLLVMPPHASYLLQPLDLGVFGPLKTHLLRYLHPFAQSETRGILKHEWFSAYAAARLFALRASNIASGFRRVGLFPFSPGQVF